MYAIKINGLFARDYKGRIYKYSSFGVAEAKATLMAKNVYKKDLKIVKI